MKRIVIVGAGYAGILTAKHLEKKLRKMRLISDYEITIIDKRPFHTMLTELHEVAAWRVEEDSIKIYLDQVFAGRQVNVVLDNIQSIDYDANMIHGEAGCYPFDYMVLASGSKPTYFGIKGAEEYSYKLWTYEDAVLLRERIMQCFRNASVCLDPDKKRRMLTFCVVGAGFTGVELAGEIAELVPTLCDRFHIPREEVTILNSDALDRVCPVLPEKCSAKIQRRLEKMGVTVILGSQGTEVAQDFIESKAKDGTKKRHAADTVIWTAGVEGSDIATTSGQALGAAGRGRVQTDDYLRAQNKKNVYIAGDNIFYIPEGEERPVPQMVENCEACAKVITNNLICDMTGVGALEKYKPAFHGVMVCVGGRYGVANVGTPKRMFALPSFLAMFSKHFINVIYFISVLGWTKIFSYLKHEFFTIRDGRSFVGGHLSNRSFTAMLVPLRIFLGAFWLYEGIGKIAEGWMSSPKLNGFIGGANAAWNKVTNPPAATPPAGGETPAPDAGTTVSWLLDKLVELFTGTFETMVAKAADVVASATPAANEAANAVNEAVNNAAGAAAGAGEAAEAVQAASGVIFHWNWFGGWLQFILVNSQSALGEVAFKVRVGLVDWMMNTLVLPSDDVQMVFQVLIVLAEIGIGLCLIAGLFTTPASVLSVLLQLMFLTSTGLFLSTWWMIFAGIACIFGAGRVFSLDYYVMPVLKRWWSNLGWPRKWYLYND